MVEAPTNSNMLQQFSNLQAMQQAHTDPGARLGAALPSLSFSVGMPTGWASSKMISYAAFKGAGGGGMGKYFVSMDTMAAWNTHDLGRVSASIDAPPIDPPHIEAPRIDAPEIRGVMIEAAHISAPNISAPSGVGQAASLSHA